RPRTEIDALCDQVIRRSLEDCDLAMFDALTPGDVLFFDGSHRVFTNSDVTVFFFEVLPRLNPGVLVHVHDIFWPWDYPPHWNERLYAEQYLLGAMLLCDKWPFRVVLPNMYICLDAELGSHVRKVLQFKGENAPFYYPNAQGDIPGVSF